MGDFRWGTCGLCVDGVCYFAHIFCATSCAGGVNCYGSVFLKLACHFLIVSVFLRFTFKPVHTLLRLAGVYLQQGNLNSQPPTRHPTRNDDALEIT